MLNIIPKLVTEKHNESMVRLPNIEEVKQTAFAMSGESAGVWMIFQDSSFKPIGILWEKMLQIW